MNLQVHYFALLREQRGLAAETVTTTTATADAFYAELRARHGFTLAAEQLKVAVNGEFAPWAQPLHDHDEVVFLPPVAGG